MSVRFLYGHCLDKLKELPDESVHMCVTSPPYWGLRAYKTPPQIWDGDPECQHDFTAVRPRHKGGPQGKGGQRADRDFSAQNEAQDLPQGDFCRHCGAWRGEHGLEPTIGLYVQHEVEIFREVRRVLRSDGTLWLNLGDTYASNGGHADTTCNNRRGQYNIGNRPDESRMFRARPQKTRGLQDADPKRRNEGQPFKHATGVREKNLCGIPWRVAFALQEDGWNLRSDIIWHKPNPMPESVTDRPTKSHEYIFLMTKSEDYFYDAEAIKEPVTGGAHHRGKGVHPKAIPPASGWARGKGKHTPSAHNGNRVKQNKSFSAAVVGLVAKRNKRTVWSVTTTPFKGAHFATFPPALITPCILAGTSSKGCCPRCWAPWERIIEKGKALEEWKKQCGADANGQYNGQNQKNYQEHKAQPASTVKARILAGMVERKTIGWKPTCSCGVDVTVPCVVMDPFGGSGTTAMVSMEHGRNSIIIELNPEYLQMGHDRLGLFAPRSC